MFMVVIIKNRDNYKYMMKLSTKLFNKSYDIPSKPLVIAMCKKSNGHLVKLCVTPI